MRKNNFMKDLSFKQDFHLDKVMQTNDKTMLQRQYNWTLTDKRENKNPPRFAFLKISKIRVAAHLPAPAHGLTPSQAKELQYILYFILSIYY
jgi:hypothetical protein